MPYRICKIFEVESGHQLSKHPGACRFPHGHSRQVEVILEADELDSQDMVCDFKTLKNLLSGFIDQFDHSLCLNSEDPNLATWKEKYPDRILVFAGEDPTTEVMARMIYREIRRRLDEALESSGDQPYPLRQKVRLAKVRVTETRTSWAEYYE
ncbi:MAG: 6-carboxytetrahydropterin synthase [Opitutales bacterium]|nr:6-carboxytetrahydropterin synthase [Opitutales bacterium]